MMPSKPFFLVRFAWWLYVLMLARRWIFKISIGTHVRYRGQLHWVNNMVRPGMCRLPNVGNRDENDGWVPKDQCRLVLSPKNLWQNFCHGYGFYMRSWFDIWCQDGIKEWMRKCNIWAGKAPARKGA